MTENTSILTCEILWENYSAGKNTIRVSEFHYGNPNQGVTIAKAFQFHFDKYEIRRITSIVMGILIILIFFFKENIEIETCN